MECTTATRTYQRRTRPATGDGDQARGGRVQPLAAEKESRAGGRRRDEEEVYKTSLPKVELITKRGVKREVRGHQGPVVIETFTVCEASYALHRTELTLRRWIDRDLIPAPFLFEEGRRKALLYSKGELEIIARELHKHSEEFQYLCEKHEHVRQNIHQYMHAYRSNHV